MSEREIENAVKDCAKPLSRKLRKYDKDMDEDHFLKYRKCRNVFC